MEWKFDIGSFFVGLLIFVAGGAMVLFYQKVADNLLSGVTYSRTKFWGLMIMILGFLIMSNLHSVLLGWFVNMIFRR